MNSGATSLKQKERNRRVHLRSLPGALVWNFHGQSSSHVTPSPSRRGLSITHQAGPAPRQIEMLVNNDQTQATRNKAAPQSPSQAGELGGTFACRSINW